MTIIKLRSGTTTQWIKANPVLALGEPGYDSDSRILKVGDGSTPWATLRGYLNETTLAATYIGLPAASIADYAVPTRAAGAPNGLKWTTKEEHVARSLGWVIATDPRYGAVGDGVTDDTAAIQAALTAAAGSTAFLPPKTFAVTRGLVLPRTSSLSMAGATLRATATITGPLLTLGDSIDWWRDRVAQGGIVDCNNLAQDAIKVACGRNSAIEGVKWLNPARHGLVLGDSGAAHGTLEMRVWKCFGDKTNDVATVGGSIGIWATSKCSDSVFIDNIVVGSDLSFVTDGCAVTHIGAHGYGISTRPTFPTCVFKDSGSDNQYLHCYADTPKQYGFWFTANSYRWTIIGGRVVNNAAIGTDNVVTGIHTDLNEPNSGTIIGLLHDGGSGATRINIDYDGYIGSSKILVLGCVSSNVTTPALSGSNVRTLNTSRLRFSGSSPTLTAGTSAGSSPPTPVLRANGRDQAGNVSFGTGTSPSAGAQVAVTFNSPFQGIPTVTVTPRNAATAASQVYVESVSSAAFSIAFATAPAASQNATTYVVDYHVDVFA